jgi:hypothetical protein
VSNLKRISRAKLAKNAKEIRKLCKVLNFFASLAPLRERSFLRLKNLIDCGRGEGVKRGAGDNLVVLAHGFQKKTQKTPAGEIALAEARKRDYLKRRRHHE